MSTNLKARIQHAVEHTESGVQCPANNSVPKDGEIVFNTNRTNFKVGDGTHQYSVLSDVIPEAQVQSDWTETDTTSMAYIQNKPTIPTVNDATFKIVVNDESAGEFTANSDTDSTVTLTIPTKTSDLTNDSGFITSSAIPTIPIASILFNFSNNAFIIAFGTFNISQIKIGTLFIFKSAPSSMTLNLLYPIKSGSSVVAYIQFFIGTAYNYFAMSNVWACVNIDVSSSGTDATGASVISGKPLYYLA